MSDPAMEDAQPLSGVYVPLITPFDERDVVALDALRSLGHEMLNAGAAGLVAVATTAEATALDADERDAVIATCAEVCGEHDAQLIVGAGTASTRTTLQFCEALSSVGAAAALVVVPYYVRPSEAAIVKHFEYVSERSPVPVVLYNIPYRTGRALGATSILELAEMEQIVGIKQAVGGIDADTLMVLANAPTDFAVLGGDDPYLFPMALMGGSGAIAASAHLCTERFVAMIRCALEGRVGEGREHAEALLPLTLKLFVEPSPAILKGVLHAQGKVPTPSVRLPLSNSSESGVAAAMEALAAGRGASSRPLARREPEDDPRRPNID